MRRTAADSCESKVDNPITLGGDSFWEFGATGPHVTVADFRDESDDNGEQPKGSGDQADLDDPRPFSAAEPPLTYGPYTSQTPDDLVQQYARPRSARWPRSSMSRWWTPIWLWPARLAIFRLPARLLLRLPAPDNPWRGRRQGRRPAGDSQRGARAFYLGAIDDGLGRAAAMVATSPPPRRTQPERHTVENTVVRFDRVFKPTLAATRILTPSRRENGGRAFPATLDNRASQPYFTKPVN